MIFNMSGGSNAGLNFKVVGGNEAPVSPSENTIWVTNPNLFDFENWAQSASIGVENGALSFSNEYNVFDKSMTFSYLHGTEVTSNSYIYTDYETDNGYTKIPCRAGGTYILKWKCLGSTKNKAYIRLHPSGQADDSLSEILDAETSPYGTMQYTPPEGVEFFTISIALYGHESTDTTVTVSDISVVEEFTPITKWTMASKNPYAYEVEVDYLNGKATKAGYFSSTGGITAQNSTNKEVYIEAYIPVKYGHNYTYNYTIASSKAMWLGIVEYTRDHTFAKRIVPVNAVTGTVQTGTYAPSSSNVVEVRLSWRTFGLDTTVEFKGTEETADTSTNGAVWIHTAVNSDARFNALKKNDLQVYPVRAKQCVNGSWKELEGHTYQNGSWKQWVPYGALYWYGDLCEEVSGGEWTPKKVKPNSENSDEYDLPTITYNFDHLLIDWRILGWGGGAAKMLNSQDLTDVSLLQLEFEGEVLQNDADLSFSVYKKESSYQSDSVASIKIIDHAKGSPQLVNRRTVTLDVSALSGAHYIRFFGWDSWSSSNSAIILKVYALRKIYSE